MTTFKQFIKELYQEEKGSTFTHDGDDYDINKLFKLSEKLPVIKTKVSDLEWINKGFKPSKRDLRREKEADDNVPILITKWHNKLVVLDGFHRLLKAEDSNIKELPARIIDKKMLDSCLIP